MVTAVVYAHDLRSKRRHRVQWIRFENDTPTIKCVKSSVSLLLSLLLFILARSIYLLACLFVWFFYLAVADLFRLLLVPPKKKKKLERIRLYICQSFGCDGFVFRMPNTNARFRFLTKWIYWLVLGEPTWIYWRLTYSILTARRIVWWVCVEMEDCEEGMGTRHQT